MANYKDSCWKDKVEDVQLGNAGVQGLEALVDHGKTKTTVERMKKETLQAPNLEVEPSLRWGETPATIAHTRVKKSLS